MAGAIQFTKSSFSTTTKYILALGDSITVGYSPGQAAVGNSPTGFSNGGYRLPLQEICRSEGKLVDFIGTQAQNSIDMVDPEHEGYSGYKLDEVKAILATRTFANAPDVILMDIGTNDIQFSYDLPNLNARLDTWLTALFVRWPSTYVVILTVGGFFGPYIGVPSPASFNSHIMGLPGTHASGARIKPVDNNAAIVAGLLSDGLHPATFGYQFLAWNYWSQLKLLI